MSDGVPIRLSSLRRVGEHLGVSGLRGSQEIVETPVAVGYHGSWFYPRLCVVEHAQQSNVEVLGVVLSLQWDFSATETASESGSESDQAVGTSK